MGIGNGVWTALRAGGGIPERSGHGLVLAPPDVMIAFAGNTTDDEGLLF